MRRVSLILAALVLILAAAIVTGLAMRHQASAAQPPARLQGTDVWPAGMRPTPAFALRDQHGERITAAGLRGQVWAITFLDSSCTQACPVEAHALAYVQHQLGPRYPLKIVIVSVRPGYDTPARVGAFARRAGLSGDWHWLLGTRKALAPVWQKYGIDVVDADTHTAAVYLVDRHGNVRVADAVPFIPRQFIGSVEALTAKVGRHSGSKS